VWGVTHETQTLDLDIGARVAAQKDTVLFGGTLRGRRRKVDDDDLSRRRLGLNRPIELDGGVHP